MTDLYPISVKNLNRRWGSRGGGEGVEVGNNNINIQLMFSLEEGYSYCSPLVLIVSLIFPEHIM